MGVTTVVARADYQRGFIDSGAHPSPAHLPHRHHRRHRQLEPAGAPAGVGLEAARGAASRRAHPAGYGAANGRHCASRNARAAPHAPSHRRQFPVDHRPRPRDGPRHLRHLRRHAVSRGRRSRRRRAAPDGSLRPRRHSRRAAAPAHRRSRRLRGHHRLRLLRARFAHRSAPAQLRAFSCHAPRRAHARLQPLLRRICPVIAISGKNRPRLFSIPAACFIPPIPPPAK